MAKHKKFRATEDQFRKALLKWLSKKREQLLDNVHRDDDTSEWCKDEAELVAQHIQTVEGLIFVNEALKVSDDEAHRQADLAYERIEELEAKLAKIEARLAKAVEALERIEDASRYFGNDPEASETTVRYAHETTRRLCATTIAEIKGGKDE